MSKYHYNSKTYKANRLRVLKRDDYTCYYCGSPANTADHILPISKGGTHEEHNLIACCHACNSGKRDRVGVFLKQRKTHDPFISIFTPDKTEQLESGWILPDRG
jgi:5-methylcytosine-specific restriction endonuclease McrA